MTVITWDPKAREFLRKLDKHLATRIYSAVDEKISKDVTRYLETIKGYDFYKIRVGDYRLFVDYCPSENHLKIRVIEHRGTAYQHLRDRL